MKFTHFDPAHFAFMRAKIRKAKNPSPDLIRALAEQAERDSLAELNAIEAEDKRNHVNWRKQTAKKKGLK